MNIRRATPDDAVALAKVHIDAWRAAYRGPVPDEHLARLDYDRRAEFFREALAAHDEETYLAEQDREALAFLTIGACPGDDVDRATTGEIWGIYLAPEHWRKGIGRLLCRHGEDILRSRGHSEAVLWVFEANDAARRFYEPMGFHADGASRTLNPGKPLTAVRYRKTLTPADEVARSGA